MVKQLVPINKLFKSILAWRDFPYGPVVKNPLSNAGDAGSIPGRVTKIPHDTWGPHATTTEPACSGARAPQLEGSLHTTTKSPCAATKTQHNQKKKRGAKKLKKNYFHGNWMPHKDSYNGKYASIKIFWAVWLWQKWY